MHEPVQGVDIYNTVTKTWSMAELSEGRYNMAVAVAGNKLYLQVELPPIYI